MTTLTLAEITPDNVDDACGIAVEKHQRHFVASVTKSLAEAYVQPEVAWPRLILDDGEPVGFVMGGFDPASPVEFLRCGIWRLNIAAGKQRRGYGRFGVHAVLDEARRRGQKEASVLWVPGEGGPEKFYLRLGFRRTGRIHEGEVVAMIAL
ncbi:GNAT family N-acetyltransferase [Amycolatopsis sp. NPDC059027]|uniref:GNAT family N-acetyltransferase n=1 Tax=Amycolatopsis sp. NPDC059027 TaxID=3346709 RepID=UPI00366D1519